MENEVWIVEEGHDRVLTVGVAIADIFVGIDGGTASKGTIDGKVFSSPFNQGTDSNEFAVTIEIGIESVTLVDIVFEVEVVSNKDSLEVGDILTNTLSFGYLVECLTNGAFDTNFTFDDESLEMSSSHFDIAVNH